ncbi:MAG: hypothetical protein PHW63_02960 [Alphaproteobacteria bacterium]|nr:hypothetical protein [Alphaproteobacteria bacterium]
MKYKRNLGERYSPLFFLNACAAAAIALGFVLYLTWLSPHDAPSLLSASLLFDQVKSGNSLHLLAALLPAAGFLYFTYDFIQLALWNQRHLSLWQQTAAHNVFVKSTAATIQVAQLVCFLCGLQMLYFAMAVFLPLAFEYSDFLSPFGLAVLGWAAYRTGSLYKDHFILPLRPPVNPAMPQMVQQAPHPVGLSLFLCAFSLIGFSFANIALFSHTQLVPFIGYIGASLALLIVLLLTIAQALPALRSSLVSATAPLAEKVLSLLLTACALTLTAATLHHLRICLVFSFAGATDIIGTFVLWTTTLLLIGLITGLALTLYPTQAALRSILAVPSFSVSTYGFVLILMAIAVSLFFFVADALVPMGLIERDSTLFWGLQLLVLALHASAIVLYLKLNRKLFAAQQPAK